MTNEEFFNKYELQVLSNLELDDDQQTGFFTFVHGDRAFQGEVSFEVYQEEGYVQKEFTVTSWEEVE